MAKEIRLTVQDRQILESYKAVVKGLGDYLGDGYELVLHSLEDLDHSAILVVNGQHSGRKVGAPITDLALSMLEVMREGRRPNGASYLTHNKNGEPLRSCTLPVCGSEGRIIGLVCINFYLNTPFDRLLNAFVGTCREEPAVEHFENDTAELVQNAVKTAENRVLCEERILPSARNKEIVALLEREGIFRIKNAVVLVAQALGISRNTVYLHLRAARNEKSFSGRGKR